MKTIKAILKVFKDRSGATAIEYALIAGIICIAVVGGVSTLGQSANDAFVDVNTKVWGS